MTSIPSFSLALALLPLAAACVGQVAPDGRGGDPSPASTNDPAPIATNNPTSPIFDECGPAPDSGQWFAEIRIAYTADDGPFDVCFPVVGGSADFTGAVPLLGGSTGIQTGETTTYLDVPVGTAYMRFVAPGADCSTRIGSRTDDSLGPFSAAAGVMYTVDVDESGLVFSKITVDE